MEIKNWIEKYVPQRLSGMLIESQGNRNLNKHVGTLKEALDSIDVSCLTNSEKEVYDMYYKCEMFNKTLYNVTFYLSPTLTTGHDVVANTEDFDTAISEAIECLKSKGYEVKRQNLAYISRKYFNFV
jgi:hypothetical protein